MLWPVPNYYHIRAGFTDERWYGQHDAIDIECVVGARVVAVASGEVIFAGNAGDCGIGVWLAHDDGARSHYCHLEPVGVVGLGHVEAGATLGYVGMTGVTRVPHLHINLFMQQKPAGVLSDWIAWVGMWAVDPEHYLTSEEEDMPLTQADLDLIGRVIRVNTDSYIVPKVEKALQKMLGALPSGGGLSAVQTRQAVKDALKEGTN